MLSVREKSLFKGLGAGKSVSFSKNTEKASEAVEEKVQRRWY